jgi:integrase
MYSCLVYHSNACSSRGDLMKKQANGMWREKATYKGVTYDLCAMDEETLRKKIYDRKAAIDAGDISTGENVKVRAWAAKWLEEYKRPSVIEKSYRLYRTNLENHILPYIGNKSMRDIRQVDLQEILNKQQGMSASHIMHVKCAITAMFKSAYVNGIIKSNPAEGLFAPAGSVGESRAFTDMEVRLLLEACREHKFGVVPLVMYYCGLRPSEVAALTVSDIDINNRTINVNKTVESGRTRRIKATKTKSGKRVVPIPDEFLPTLEAKTKDARLLIATNLSGKMLTDRETQRYWQTILRIMDIKAGAKVDHNKIVRTVIGVADTSKSGDIQIKYDLKLYWLRHTYCTNLQRAGVPINIAKDLMGHCDTKMVERIYTHFTDDQFEAAREKINSLNKQKV